MNGDLQLDFSELLDQQGQIDVIVHKLTDHINRFLGQGQEALKWMEMVQVCMYFIRPPGTVVPGGLMFYC